MDKKIHRITILLAKARLGIIGEEEREELDSWLDEPENRELLRTTQPISEMKSDFSEYVNTDIEKARLVMLKKAKASNRTIKYYLLRFSVAASILLFISAILFYFGNKNSVTHEDIALITPQAPYILSGEGHILTLDTTFKSYADAGIIIEKKDSNSIHAYNDFNYKEVIYRTLKVPKGAEYNIVLSDGSEVWMNADSELTFPSFFAENSRDVKLSGEAYFKVNKDSSKCFRVHMEDYTVEVLGTEFNINSYPNESYSYTTLLEGSIKVYTNEKETILVPGSQAITGGDIFDVQKVNTKYVIGWRNGLFSFEKQTLDQIISTLMRWYNFDVVFENDNLKNVVFKGNIPRYESIHEVLEILEHTKEVKFKIDKNTVYVKSV